MRNSTVWVATLQVRNPGVSKDQLHGREWQVHEFGNSHKFRIWNLESLTCRSIIASQPASYRKCHLLLPPNVNYPARTAFYRSVLLYYVLHQTKVTVRLIVAVSFWRADSPSSVLRIRLRDLRIIIFSWVLRPLLLCCINRFLFSSSVWWLLLWTLNGSKNFKMDIVSSFKYTHAITTN